MEEQVDYFTQEQLQSPYYWLRNKKNEPKRLKFLVFSNTAPSTDHNDNFHKRVVSFDGSNRDVDYRYLKENFINRFPSKIGEKDHFKIHQRRKEQEMFDILEKLKGDDNLRFYDCFVFIFLTFCSEDGISKIHCEDEIVPLEKILEKVSDVKGMNGKPKIFLVQADDLKLMQKEEMKTKGGIPFETKPQKIPTDADRLIITSTIPAKGFVVREEDDTDHSIQADPSFLIQAFVEAINENEGEMDLLSLTVDINSRVAKMIKICKESKNTEHGDQLQVPCITSTFRQLLLL